MSTTTEVPKAPTTARPKNPQASAPPLPVKAEPEGKKLQAFADEINRVHRRTVEAIIELGRKLLDIKAKVGHGGFSRLFASHAASVPRPIQFGLRTAERLMEIAKSPGLSKCDIVSHLPATGIKVLGRLATLTPDELRRGISAGWVHPSAALCSTNDAIAKLIAAEPAPEHKDPDFCEGLDEPRSANPEYQEPRGRYPRCGHRVEEQTAAALPPHKDGPVEPAAPCAQIPAAWPRRVLP